MYMYVKETNIKFSRGYDEYIMPIERCNNKLSCRNFNKVALIPISVYDNKDACAKGHKGYIYIPA